MSREIKFRAWDRPTPNSAWFMYPHESIVKNGAEYLCDNETFTKRIIMQYTGLKDKNGKEIYEGDIVEIDDLSDGIVLIGAQPKKLIEVYFDVGCGGYHANIWCGAKKSTIKGNIHEHGDLLK